MNSNTSEASKHGNTCSERIQYAKAGTQAQHGSETVNPQTYARSKMDNTKPVDVYKKCVHKVKKCRHCHIIPLVSKSGHVVNYFVEHHKSDGRTLVCTIGLGNVRQQNVKKSIHARSFEAEAEKVLRCLAANEPEMATEDDDAEPSVSPEVPVRELSVDKDLANMHMESSVITEPSSIEHIQSTLGSQLELVQDKLRTSFSAPLVKKSARSLEQLVLLFVGLQYDTSLPAIVSRCATFLSAITEGGIVMTLTDQLMKYAQEASIPALLKGKTIKEAFEIEQSQPSDPEMFAPESMKIWETMKQGIFTKHLSYILGTVFAFSTCKIKNIKFNHPIYEKVLEHASMTEIDGMDLVDHAIKLYNWTSTVGMACLEARSLDPLTVNSSTLAKCHAKYYEWNKKFLDFKRSGRSTPEERQLMFVEVETIYNKLEQFVKVQKEKFMTLQASSLYREVLVLYNDVRDFVQQVDQVKVAKAYHLTGPPKAGKSALIPKCAEQMCLARGVKYRPEDCAQINLLSAFQDELKNSTQIVVVNESLPIKEHLAKSVETAYNTSLALVDPVPYHPNRSSLDEKAKNTLSHIGVLSTGNTVQPFVTVAKTKGAWERRYTIIEVTVRPEYSDEFGRLESSKIDGSEDYHTFDIYEVVYHNDERKIVYKTLNGEKCIGINTKQLFEFIRRDCIDHYAEQDRIMERHQKSTTSGCLECKRLSFMCTCPNKDDHTTAGQVIGQQEADVYSRVPDDEVCPAQTAVGKFKPRCKYHNGGLCAFCGREEPAEPEMGVVETAVTTASSLVWSSVLPWVNPFIKFKWLWSIDNNVMRVFHEELVEELSYWPEQMACAGLSLIPPSWKQREDGSKTWFGRKQDAFLRMVAAEKQIFLPLSYLFRRALTWGIISFIVFASFSYFMEYLGLNPREYETVVFKKRELSKWDWWYLYPEYSEYVFKRRDAYAEWGIYTDNYLDWQAYFVDIYFWQKLLGKLCIPWFFTYTKYVPVIEQRMYQWWLMPTCVAVGITVFLFFFMWWRRAIGFQQRYDDLKRRTVSDPQMQRNLYDRARRHYSEYNALVPTAVGVVGVIVTGLVLWNSMRTPEHGLKDDERRTSWNDWFNFTREVAIPQEENNSAAIEQQNNLFKALTYCETLTPEGKERVVHGVYLEPGILMLPRHIFKPDPFKDPLYEYLDLKLDTNGVLHKVRAYSKNLVQIAGKDCVILKVPKAPKLSVTCKTMLPKRSGKDNIRAAILYLKRKQSDEPLKSVLTKRFDHMTSTVNAEYENFIDCAGYNCGRGVSYKSDVTKVGFCGCVVVADRKDGAILGFHISGKPGLISRTGYAQEITFEDYETAVAKLKLQPHYTNTPEMKTLSKTRLGMNLVPYEGPHPKTEMFVPGAMDEYPSLEVVGHDPALPRYRSRVRRSMLSPLLEKHCGQKCRWKAPYLKEPWKHHNKALKRIATGAWEVPPDSMKWARDDYWSQIIEPLKAHIRKHPDFCRVLTLDEAINGHPDSRYMKRFRMDTAAGIRSGNKVTSGLFVEIEPYEDGRKRYALSPEALEYYNEMLESFDNNQAIGIFVRTCLKDEVVKEDSEKVRIFYILECIFGLLCRQHYLPIAEFISRNPIETECMVGVNCAGPEWEALVSHINELATDAKLNDWDFSGYDIRRSSDMMCTSLNIQRKIGEEMCYTKKELNRMEMIGEELRCPMVNFNGTIMFMYLWCSGNSMTVYGNSIENSLHQRAAFHWNGVRLRGDKFYELGRYIDNEHIGTYGDDGYGGSRPEVRDITCFSSRKMYFDFIGMGITDARKGESSDEFVHSNDVDFLKRRSVYHELLGLRVGALDQESIWKMGHMSSGSGEDEDLAISAIQTMLHEAFLHGETFYEWLRTRLRLCAEEIFIWTKELDVTYYQKAQFWKEKYDPEE